MRIVKMILFLVFLCLISSIGYGQGNNINFGGTRPIDTAYAGRSLKIDSAVRFLRYANSDATKYLTVNQYGFLELGTPAGGGGSADSATFVTVTRLGDSLGQYVALRDSNSIYRTAWYTDSTFTTIFGALATLDADKVPYTNATDSVDLGAHIIRADGFNLNLSPSATPTGQGSTYWDVNDQTAALVLNDEVTLQMGQEMHVRARNNSGVQINDGQVVYISAAQGNTPVISLARADDIISSYVIGVATENIPDNTVGYITTFGTVNGFNTSDYADGAVLYLSPYVAGAVTDTVPESPYNVVIIGYALNSTNNGKLFVRCSTPLSADTALTASSVEIAASQHSVKEYVDNRIPDVSGFVPYTGATTDLNLGEHNIYATDAVFTHSVGSGNCVSITKVGDGEALTAVKTSGSGNAASITGGTTLLETLNLTNDLGVTYGGTGASTATSINATPITYGADNTISIGVTSVGVVAGTGVSIGGTSPITSAGTYTITNTAPDQVVTLTASTNVTVTGSYPSYTISATGGGGGGSVYLTATAPLQVDSTIDGSTKYYDVSLAPTYVYTITETTSMTFDGDNGLSQMVTLTGNDTIALDTASMVMNYSYELEVNQDGSGGHTLYWSDSYISFQGGTSGTSGYPFQDTGADEFSVYFIRKKSNGKVIVTPAVNNSN